MIIPEELEEEIDRSSRIATQITDGGKNGTNSITHAIPSPPPATASKEQETVAAAAADDGGKKTTTGAKPDRRRQNGRKVNFFGARGILGAAVMFIAIASNIIPLAISKRLKDYYDLPTITPYTSVYSATASIQFEPLNPFYIPTAYDVAALWAISFNITNPSQDHVLEYSNLVAVVYFNDNPLWVTTIPGFQQGKGQQDFVNATFPAVSLTVENSVALAMFGDVTVFSSGSSSGFSVRVLGSVGQKKPGRRNDRDAGSMRALCRMDVEFLKAAGRAVAESSRGVCEVSVAENGYASWFELGLHTFLTYAAYQFMHKSSDWAFGG